MATKANSQLLRLKCLPITSLPSHPILAPHQAPPETPPPATRTFLLDTLTEAHTFMTAFFPAQFQKKGAPRQSGISTAQVDLLATDITHSESSSPNGTSSNANARTENWFARRSVHTDATEHGTASWDEFVAGLFEQHSIHEAQYTPDIFDAFEVVDWVDMITDEDRDALANAGWEDVRAEVYEMGHRIQPPMNNRVFAVLLVRGLRKKGGHEFVTAQVPVDISAVKEAMYSNGRHRKDGDTALKREKVIVGEYVSVERVVKQDDGTVVWEMGTASDAKGWLPPGLQKMGVPSAIIKDVGYFIEWADKQRQES